MHDDETRRLFDLADVVLAVGRQLRAVQERSGETCTPVESAVMRVIDRAPGTSARAVSEATLLPASNVSRALRGLEEKGLVRRDADTRDARGVRLHPTARSRANLAALQRAWGGALAGILPDGDLDAITASLREIEDTLARRGEAAP